MESQISTFVISILVISLMITVFGAYYASTATQYGATYQDNITGMDRFVEINAITVNVSAQVSNQTPSSGGFNVLGDFLSTAGNAAKATWQSMTAFKEILNSGFSNIPLGDSISQAAAQRIMLIIVSIVFVIFIFIIIALYANRSKL